MTPLQTLKAAITVFEKLGCRYCLIGGHAASLYRVNERVTKDVDFALMADPIGSSRELAQQVIRELGLTPMIGFIPQSAEERPRGSICMVTSAPAKNALTGIIDILLPEIPWISKAVERAQYNRLDLGFAKVPVIPPEDLIVAKCYSLRNSPDRFQDLDDLKEIFQNVKDLDHDYLRASLEELNLSIPEAIRKYAPDWI